jgi:hypothetical protein
VEIDFISRRYGCLPNDILKLSIDDFSFLMLVASEGLKEENKQIEKQNRELKSRNRKHGR